MSLIIEKVTAVTPPKLEANRRNAQRSTGPKTAAGKAASKMNALKHGVLARSVVVRGLKFRESANEFQELCREFYASLQPVGPLEETLVDQIVQAAWRLRRARTAESGEIALSVDTGWWEREKDNPLPLELARPDNPLSLGLVARLQESGWGCRYLLHLLGQLRQRVESAGKLCEAALNDYKSALRHQPDATVPLTVDISARA